MRIDINDKIIVDTEICHGKPTFKGTRVMVWQILEMLEGGLSAKDIIRSYPSLSRKHIKAALHYAADLTRGADHVHISVPLPA